MTRSPTKAPATEHVTCAVCLKEVPRSEARVAEAVDYVAYFCGLDCFERWQRDHPAASPPAAAPR